MGPDDAAANANTPAGDDVKSTQLLTTAQAEAALADIIEHERSLESDIENLLLKAEQLCKSESRNLVYASEQHKQVPPAVRKLQDTLQQASGVADELSGRVRRLDVVCGRIGETLKLVDDMLELRECSDHVMKAISTGDFERAARYVARFRASQDALPPGTDDASIKILQDAELKLGAAVRSRFEAAIMAKDTEGVSRFAKLFHPLGIAQEGVAKYTEFIRRSLAEKCAHGFKTLAPAATNRADAEPNPYAEALTTAFMQIADIVQDHQQSVEEEFGSANFIVVLRGLVEEADILAMRIIDRFTKDHTKVFKGNSDMRLMGATLEETALITQRTQQFHGYIHNVAIGVVEMIEDKETWASQLPEGCNSDDGLIRESKLVRRMQEFVSDYVTLENKFLQSSVEKALQEADMLDPDDQDRLITTLVDDTFFILNESLNRAVSTYEVQAVGATLNCVSDVFGDESQGLVVRALLGNLSTSEKSYSNWVSHAKNIATPDLVKHPLYALFTDYENNLRPNLNAASSWPHSLNNLQQCLEFMDDLKATMENRFEETFPPDGPDKDKLPMLHNLLNMALDEKRKDLEKLHIQHCKKGVTMFFRHLRPALDPLSKLDYNVDDSMYADFQVNDPFAKAFNQQTEVIYRHIKVVINPASCEEMMQELASKIVSRVEKEVASKRFSLLGALQFESDVRILCSFFTTVSEQALRHKFARLFDMARVLSLDNVDELRELFSELGSLKLSPEEIRKLIESRVDFDASERDLNLLLLS